MLIPNQPIARLWPSTIVQMVPGVVWIRSYQSYSRSFSDYLEMWPDFGLSGKVEKFSSFIHR